MADATNMSIAGRRMSPGADLRLQMASPGGVLAAGCFDSVSASIAEAVGFAALHVSGSAVEAALIGEPDIGMTTLTELADHVGRICDAVPLPAIVDVDTGFGGPANVDRTTRQMIRAGAAGMHIEDQTFPKRSPTTDGRTVVSRRQAIERIRIAAEARTEPDFVLIGRSDAEVISLDETVVRCNEFLAAGADLAFPMCMAFDGIPYMAMTASQEVAMLEFFTEEIDGPVLGMCYPVGPNRATVQQVRDCGVNAVILPTSSFKAATSAMYSVLKMTIETGTSAEYFNSNPDALPPGGVAELLGVDRFRKMDAHVIPEHFDHC